MIEVLEFHLRAGQDAPDAAARCANAAERYLTPVGARDLTAVVSELVMWLSSGDPVPRTLRLELSVTSTLVRVSVTAAERPRTDRTPASAYRLRETLPVTAALAARYGVEANRRTRVWAEFDRYASPVPSYTEPTYS